MRVISADETAAALPWDDLIDGIGQMFRQGCEMPLRHHHSFAVPGEDDGTLLLMPAWLAGSFMGVKMVNVVPGNSARGMPAIAGVYLLSSAATGTLLAIIDGAELTARRTAAASALAARYLARKDASRLLIVGAGKMSLNLIEAHSAVRQITSVKIWARRIEQADAIADAASARGFNAIAVTDLETEAAQADIISCCTLSRAPLIKGAWLRAGTHVDLIGAFKPDMRETDSPAVARASVFVDTKDGALGEGGDIVQAMAEGAIGEGHIKSDLFNLCRDLHQGRTSDDEITLFKSVGAALEDLAGAIVAYRNIMP